MKVTLGSEILKKCVRSVEGGLGGINIASKSILIEAKEDGSLVFMTNSIRTGYIAEVSYAEVHEPGTAIVDGQSLSKIANVSVSDKVTLVLDKGSLTLKDGKRKASLLVTEEFTPPPVVDDVISVVKLSSFQAVLRAASHLSASDGTVLDSVYMDSKNVISTDRSKGAIIPFKSDLKEPIIIAKLGVREIMRLEHDGDVELRSDGRFLTISIGDENESLTLTVQLLGGEKYPDLATLVDSVKYVQNIAVHVDTLYSEFNYVSLISDNTNQVCTLVINNDGTAVIHASAHSGSNEIKTGFDYDVIDSIMPENPFEFNINILHITALMKSIKDHYEHSGCEKETVNIYFDDPTKPIRIESEGMVQVLSAIKAY